MALIEYMIEDTEQEREIWEMVRAHPAPGKIVLASLLKTLFPIRAIIWAGLEDGQVLLEKWEKAYSWLSERERSRLIQFARFISESGRNTFHERLEEAALRLITHRSL